MTACLAYLLIAHSARLTLTEPGARVPVLLGEIAERTGLRLEAAPEFKNEVLCLRVVDAPVGETLTRIAGVLGGEWKNFGKVQHLRVSPAALRREQETIVEERKRACERNLGAVRRTVNDPLHLDLAALREYDSIARKMTVDENRQMHLPEPLLTRFGQLRPPSPRDRFLVRMLDSIPGREWWGLPEGARVVYSDHPNAMQRQLPADVAQELKRFADEQKELSDAEGPGSWIQDTYTPPRPEDVKKLNVVIQTRTHSWEGDVAINSLDRDGKWTEIATQIIDRLPGDELYDALVAALTPKQRAQRLPVDPDVDRWRNLWVSSPAQFASKPVSLPKDWRAILSDPVGHEPISLLAGPRLIDCAGLFNLQVIADLDDDTVNRAWPESPNVEDPPNALRFLLRFIGNDDTFALTGGWITIAAKHPSDGRLRRIDRSRLKALLDRAAREKTLSIDNVCDYLAEGFATLRGRDLDTKYVYLCGLPTEAIGSWGIGPIVTGTELYGRLSASQRTRLSAGSRISFADLPGSAREMLAKHIFFRARDDEESARIAGEPTERFPNGLPATGFVEFSRDTTSLSYMLTRSVDGHELEGSPPNTLSAIGWELGPLEPSAADFAAAAHAAGYSRIKVVSEHAVTVGLHYADDSSETFPLYEILPSPPRYLEFSALTPEALKAFKDGQAYEIDRRRKAAETPVRRRSPPPGR